MKLLSFFTSFLHYLPPEASHWIALNSLKILHKIGFMGLLDKQYTQRSDIKTIKDLRESKVKLGFAAGLDKDGDYIDCLASLGVSFIELGTVTPKPQRGNSKPRLFRNKSRLALMNKMGFNNKGVTYLVDQIKKRKSTIPLGISIGKNFDTSIEDAYLDYLFCLEKAYRYASYIAVNISSPNTKDLRKLGQNESLDFLLNQLKEKQLELAKTGVYTPLLVKVSPDETEDQILKTCELIQKYSIDGIICTNTTINHDFGYEAGGLSGKPLMQISTDTLAKVKLILGNEFLVVASGGVMDVEAYKQKLSTGADLVQVYTGFIYEGPKLIHDILKV